MTAEECKTPEEYITNVPQEDIIREIFEVLNDDFYTEFEDEYYYYMYYLQEHGVTQ